LIDTASNEILNPDNYVAGVPHDQFKLLRDQASMDMGAYGYQLAAERKDKSGDDLISLLINVEIDGHKVTEM
jgi:cytochrome P450